MSWKSILCAFAAVMLNSAAMAATPILSGDYILSMTILCQGGLKVTKDSNGRVTNIAPLYEARLESDIGTAHFNNTTKRVTISGFTVFGQTVQMTGALGSDMHEDAVAFTRSYDNTDTTIGIGPDLSKVVYGKVVSGIVQNAFFQQLGTRSPNTHCALKGTIFRK